jgi:hypothetical protein
MHECRLLLEKPEGKSTLGRNGCRKEQNTKMYLKIIVREDVEWPFLAQYRNNWLTPVNAMINLRVP